MLSVTNSIEATEIEGLKQQNEQKYGHGLIGDLFRPHLTFTRLQSGSKVDVPKVLGDVENISGSFL